MDQDSGRAQGKRASALWGTGNRGGEHRSSALWGTGSRGGEPRSRRAWATLAMSVFALMLPLAAAAEDGDGDGGGDGDREAFVPAGLLQAAMDNPDRLFTVIVEGERGRSSGDVSNRVIENYGQMKRKFRSIPGAHAELKGRQLLRLAERDDILAITPDSAVASAAYEDAEMWRVSTTVDRLWGDLLSPAPQAPAIAVVDSGVDASRLLDFGTRVVADVVICSLCPAGSAGDEQGHGTMVAGLAAGAEGLHPGVAQNAPVVSIRTSDKDGQSYVSDVIAAADWILEHRDAYNIRVANFSLARADVTSARVDPLNHAVERLWFAGVVVVAAAGNHGSADGPVLLKSPANDPFVITVGAVDQHSSSSVADDTRPAWSAYGVTVDGFQKPDVGAPGRYMVAAVPMLSSLATLLPERVVAEGYMWMSGTSFSAPVVSGAAAQILARHPEWTPDQVKGALMLTAKPTAAGELQVGVGEIDAAAAAALSSAPDANENLNGFVSVDSATGAKAFNHAAWAEHVNSNAAWSSAAWSSAAWSSAAWSSAAWSSAAWNEAAWAEYSSTEAAWNEAAWSEAAWASAAWAE